MPHRLIEIASYISDMTVTPADEIYPHQLRSMINRAYYAAHLTAKQACDDHGLVGIGKSHERVVDALGKKWKPESKKLDQLRVLRNDADYKWDRPITWQDARKSLKKSREIIEVLHNH